MEHVDPTTNTTDHTGMVKAGQAGAKQVLQGGKNKNHKELGS